jgi:hypothetical protein
VLEVLVVRPRQHQVLEEVLVVPVVVEAVPVAH